MNEFFAKKVGENLFAVNFEGERLFLYVENDKVRIEASNGVVINEYVKSGDYAKFLKYLSEQEIKILPL